MKEPTHIVFDDDKMVISPNLTVVFLFLANIEKDIEYLLDLGEKAEALQKGYQDLLGLSMYFMKKLKDNNIKRDYKMDDPNKIVKRFDSYLPIRSLFIVLFAQLETIFCLYIVYNEETDDKKLIRHKATDKNLKIFLNDFVLNDRNNYYKQNKLCFSNFSADKLRALRNSLTHFFSVGEISIIPKQLEEQSKRLSNELKKQQSIDSLFLSENQLFLLVRGGAKLLLKLWSEDYKNNNKDFERKIKFVKSVVEREGAVMVKGNDLNILN